MTTQMLAAPQPIVTGPSLLSQISSFLALFGAARSCAAAVENHRYPAAADLRRLGIDPDAFARIRLG